MSTSCRLIVKDNTAGVVVIRFRLYFLLILSLLMGFASISTDMYLPAMPAMSRALHAAKGMIELTVSGYLIGFSLGQLLWGPISDKYGRKPIIAAGIVLFITGAAGCALSQNIQTMIGWRVVQAIGASSCVSLSRAMVRDIYTGNRAAQMLSILITVMAIAPLLGPFIGGQIIVHSSWQTIFWTLVCIGIITLVGLCTIPETLPPHRRNKDAVRKAAANYLQLLRSRSIIAYAGSGGFLTGGVFAYVAGSPNVYIDYFGVPETYYGFFFGSVIAGIMAVNLINSRLVVRYGFNRMLWAGSLAAMLTSLFTVVIAWSGFGGLWSLAVTIFIFISASGLIQANSLAGAMADHPEKAGAVSSLIGSIQYGCGIFGSALVGIFADGSPRPLGVLIAVAGIGSYLFSRLLDTSSAGNAK